MPGLDKPDLFSLQFEIQDIISRWSSSESGMLYCVIMYAWTDTIMHKSLYMDI